MGMSGYLSRAFLFQGFAHSACLKIFAYFATLLSAFGRCVKFNNTWPSTIMLKSNA